MDERFGNLNREHSSVTIVYMFKKKQTTGKCKNRKRKEKKKTPTTLWQMIKCLLRQSSKAVKCWSCLLSVVTLQKS